MHRRILGIGDIHGNLLALNQFPEGCEYDPQDLLIQLGDVADRYPDTEGVVEKLLAVPNLIAIPGNHDSMDYELSLDRLLGFPCRWINNALRRSMRFMEER